MPSLKYRKQGLWWVPWEYGGNTSIPVGRSGLVAGVHKPGAATTGPYAVATFQDVYPSSGNEITITTTVPQYRKRYWGCVKATVAARFDECLFAGPDPLTYGDGFATKNKGAVQNFGGTPPTWEIWDSRIDQSLWLTAAAPGGPRAKMNPHGFGVHGCNVIVERTEIVNFADAWNFLGPNGTNPTAELAQYTRLKQSWLHKGYYENDVRSVSDGQVHCDGFQFNFGRNVDIIGNVIGGDRVPLGYNTWPGWPSSNGPGYNAGDDFAYSAIMMTQEVPPSANSILTNILIDANWLGGGTATMNMPVERGHDGSGTTISNNRFVRRGVDWGKTLAATALPNPAIGSPGNWEPFQRNTGPGVYFTNNAGWNATYSGNVYEDTGLPIPIP